MTAPSPGWRLPRAPAVFTGDDAEAVRYLQDRAAIREVVTRWFEGVNKRDMDMIASCYTPDTEGEYRGDYRIGLDSTMEKIAGVKHAAVFMDIMGNHLVEIHGDTASAETYAIQHVRSGPPLDQVQSIGQVDMRSGLRCLDDLVRRAPPEAGWLIHRRVVVPDWGRLDPVSHPPLPLPALSLSKGVPEAGEGWGEGPVPRAP